MVKQGRILKGIGGFYYVEAEQTTYECKARGVFRKRGTTPLAGDWVQICIDNDTGTIEEIFPRKNMLVRPPCANIDQMFLVASVCDPSPNLLVLDKMIAVAEDQEMEPILVISKTDLQSADELEHIYRKAGIQVITVSSVSGQGIERIKMLLTDKISVFTGNSGVGKSSLLNCISPEFQQETGIISSKLGRGKHTTRQVELLKLPYGGYVADTPGFSTMDMERYNIVKKEFTSDAAAKYFNTGELVKILDRHYHQKEDTSRKIWTIYMFLVWYRTCFQQDYANGTPGPGKK